MGYLIDIILELKMTEEEVEMLTEFLEDSLTKSVVCSFPVLYSAVEKLFNKLNEPDHS